jgi:hypothetical protein
MEMPSPHRLCSRRLITETSGIDSTSFKKKKTQRNKTKLPFGYLNLILERRK